MTTTNSFEEDRRQTMRREGDPVVKKKTEEDWLEEVRKCKELLLEASLTHASDVKKMHNQCESDKLKLKHAISSSRVGCILVLLTMIRKVSEPARFIFQYPESWSYKIAQLTNYPVMVICWFTVATMLLIPLLVMMVLNPRDRINTKVKDYGMIGLLMGAIGYGYMASASIALGIDHLIDSYVGATVLLSLAALWVASWSNNLALRKQATRLREHRCDPVQ